MLNKEICKECQLKIYSQKIDSIRQKIADNNTDDDACMEHYFAIGLYKQNIDNFNRYWSNSSLTYCPANFSKPLPIEAKPPENCYYILEQILTQGTKNAQ